MASAYWGIGISCGMLGQWGQAISNLESALKIDKDYSDAKTALKWAKDQPEGRQERQAGERSTTEVEVTFAEPPRVTTGRTLCPS